MEPNISKEETTKPEPLSQKRKKVQKDISNEVVLNFQFDDFDPHNEKYTPKYYKYQEEISVKTVSILDQNRFRFIVDQTPSIIDNYSHYEKGNYSSVDWKDISLVLYYHVGSYQCPICLEYEIICPKITECGHVFCWPCLVNFYNYSNPDPKTRKAPKCPLCSKKIDLVYSTAKFCEIIQCYDYSSMDNDNREITFNLIMRNKRSPTLYNITIDPELNYWKKEGVKEMMHVPYEKDDLFAFSRIFYTTTQFKLERLFKYREKLEQELKEEMEFYADQRRIASLNECLEETIKMIASTEKLIENETEKANKDESSITEVTRNIIGNEPINYSKYFLFYQENYGDLYYLHPLLHDMIKMEYQNEDSFPSEITGVILDIEMHQITYQLKSKYSYLAHLRIGSIIYFVEIDINHLISSNTYKAFANELKKRAKLRLLLSKEEKSYVKFIETKMIQESKAAPKFLPLYSDKDDIKELVPFTDTPPSNTNESEPPSEIKEEPKKVNGLKALLNKEEELRQEEYRKKNFLFNDADFPTFEQEKDTPPNDALPNQKKTSATAGGKKKKKKFAEMNPEMLQQIETNFTTTDIAKEKDSKKPKPSDPKKGPK